MLMVQGKEGLKTKVFFGTVITFSMFVIQKRFKTIIDKGLRITVALENIH